MIVRILGEGQYELADSEAAVLNTHDDALERAVEAGDEPAFQAALGELLKHVRRVGRPVPLDSLAPSEAILPGPDARLADVRALLRDEGLIPG